MGTNTGSAKKVLNYLEKENKGKTPGEKAWFFSHDKDKVGFREALQALDNNKKKLSRRDAKFYMVNISPSQEELAHIGNDPAKLRAYTRRVMDAYAQNFGKGLRGEDLLYFAKIEQHRYYKGNDAEVVSGQVKQGAPKPGLQTHIHVIVSRKDNSNRLKLSPLSHHRGTTKGPVKGGFDRSRFFGEAEAVFDEQFRYLRPKEKTFAYLNAQKKGISLGDRGNKHTQPVAVVSAADSSKALGLRQTKQLNQALRRNDATHREVAERRKRRWRGEEM